jgi:nitroreductase
MIIKEIRNRRSIRSFKPDPVSDEALTGIIKAAEFAPSAKHIRPLEYVIVKDQKIKDELFKSAGQDFIKAAPALIVAVSDTKKSDFAVQDLSIASGYMFLQACALGLGTVWRNVYDTNRDEIKKILGVPANYTVINIIPVGYPAEDLPPHDDSEFDPKKIHHEKF